MFFPLSDATSGGLLPRPAGDLGRPSRRRSAVFSQSFCTCFAGRFCYRDASGRMRARGDAKRPAKASGVGDTRMTYGHRAMKMLAIALCAVDLLAAALAHRHRHEPGLIALCPDAGYHGPGLSHGACSRSACQPETPAAPEGMSSRARPHAPSGEADSSGRHPVRRPDRNPADCSLCRHLGQPVAPAAFFAAPAPSGPACIPPEHVTPQFAPPLAARIWARGPPSMA